MKKSILSICMMAVTFCATAQTIPTADVIFANDAAQAGMLEVKLGELALKKGKSEDVKKLGQHMITDHTKANKELMALATKKSIKLPTTLSVEGKAAYEALSKTMGEDFDKAYSTQMIKDHDKAVSKFKIESETGQDSDLKSWASKTLPVLEHHLMMSHETDDKINKK